jgi:hypothetical protein
VSTAEVTADTSSNGAASSTLSNTRLFYPRRALRGEPRRMRAVAGSMGRGPARERPHAACPVLDRAGIGAGHLAYRRGHRVRAAVPDPLELLQEAIGQPAGHPARQHGPSCLPRPTRPVAPVTKITSLAPSPLRARLFRAASACSAPPRADNLTPGRERACWQAMAACCPRPAHPAADHARVHPRFGMPSAATPVRLALATGYALGRVRVRRRSGRWSSRGPGPRQASRSGRRAR